MKTRLALAWQAAENRRSAFGGGKMKRLVPVLLLILVCGVALGGGSGSAPSPASCKEPENHKFVVDRLFLYHHSGEYKREIRYLANSPPNYFNAPVKYA